MVLDLDNTIVPWHTAELDAPTEAWLAGVRAAGMRLCLLTNNYGSQAKTVARRIDAALVGAAFKPLPASFRRAASALGTPASACAVIGDQLFTDVLGGKLAGMKTILVKPISDRDFVTTKVLRAMERPVLRGLRRHAPRGRFAL